MKKHFTYQLFILLFISCTNLLSQNNVGVGTNTPSAEAKLDISSATQGLLIPRMSSAQRLTLADETSTNRTANGMMVYDVTLNRLMIYDSLANSANGKWQEMIPIETDPQVSSTTSNKIPKWNGTSLVDGIILDNGTGIGIGGTPALGSLLTVNGNTNTTNFQMTTGAGASKVLQSDASGNASWVNPTSLTISETDPEVSSTTSNKIPKWNGTSLVDGIILDNGTGIGIGGTPALGSLLTVNGNTNTTNFQMTTGAGANKVLQSDASGNASWVNPTSLTISETDPEVSSTTSNKIPKWNGTSLVDGIILDNGTGVGIGGSPALGSLLTVNGNTKTTNFQMTTGAGASKVLQSDASGNASWVNPTSLTISETDPEVSSTTSNKIPKWNGTTLVDGIMIDDGTGVGIGGSPGTGSRLTVNGNTKTTNFQMTTGAGTGKILQSDASGNASWVTSPSPTVDWSIYGNAGINPAINFIGTIDSTNMVLKTNNQKHTTFFADGSWLTGDSMQGGGTKTFFDASKGAFRTGDLTYFPGGRRKWDKDSLGIGSFACGSNTKAKGNYSFATGDQSNANGICSIAIGSYTNAYGNSSISVGNTCTASGDYSIAMGYLTDANSIYSTALGLHTHTFGEASTALGKYSIASGEASIAIGYSSKSYGIASSALGYYTEANGDNSTTIGYLTKANGNASTSMGSVTIANGFASTSMGDGTIANGCSSTSMGKGTIANGYSSLVIGQNNDSIVAPQTLPNSLTPLFIIGNGTSTSNTSNAMVVRQDGNVGISTNTPSVKMHINGALAIVPNTGIVVNADNFNITVSNESYIRLSGDGASVASRTITLSNGLAAGQILFIECTSNGVQIDDNVATNNTNVNVAHTLASNDVIQLLWNGTDWLEVSFSDN